VCSGSDDRSSLSSNVARRSRISTIVERKAGYSQTAAEWKPHYNAWMLWRAAQHSKSLGSDMSQMRSRALRPTLMPKT
jgi:hypothetical protein